MPSSPPPLTGKIPGTDIWMTLPEGWFPLFDSQIEESLERAVSGATDERLGLYQGMLEDFDRGVMRLVAIGSANGTDLTGSLTVEVEAGDASLDDAVARIDGKLDVMPRIAIDRDRINHPIGKADRSTSLYAAPVDSGEDATIVISYVFRLDTGETLWIWGLAPAAAEDFELLVEDVVRSLRRG